ARAAAGVRRRHIPVPAANWPASCGPSFGPFRRPLAVFEGPFGAHPARARRRSTWIDLASSEAMDGRRRSAAFCALARRRASQRQAGARRACSSAGMREFAPARLAREAQGSFADTKSAKPSCRALGFGYFPRKESNSLAAEASETFAKALRSRHGRKWIPAFAGMTTRVVAGRRVTASTSCERG